MARGGSELGRLGLIRLGLARVYWATRASPSQQVWAAAQPSRSLATMAVRALWLVCMGKLGCSRARVPVLRTARWLHVAAARAAEPLLSSFFFPFFFSFFSSLLLPFPSSASCGSKLCLLLLLLLWQPAMSLWRWRNGNTCAGAIVVTCTNTKKIQENKTTINPPSATLAGGPLVSFFFHNSRARPWVQLLEFLHEKQTQKCQNH